MQERLVDVLNDKNNVLHVFPIQIEAQDVSLQDLEQEALKAAVATGIVPESEKRTLKARPHVSRGGALMPYGDALQTKNEREIRFEEKIRERAYFLWQEAGCPDNQAHEFWQRACEIQHASAG